MSDLKPKEFFGILIGGSIFTLGIFILHRCVNNLVSWADLGLGAGLGIWLSWLVAGAIAEHQAEFLRKLQKQNAPPCFKDTARGTILGVIKTFGASLAAIFLLGLWLIWYNWFHFW